MKHPAAFQKPYLGTRKNYRANSRYQHAAGKARFRRAVRLYHWEHEQLEEMLQARRKLRGPNPFAIETVFLLAVLSTTEHIKAVVLNSMWGAVATLLRLERSHASIEQEYKTLLGVAAVADAYRRNHRLNQPSS